MYVPEPCESCFDSESVCDRPVDSCSPHVNSDGVSHGQVDVITDDPCLDGYKNFMSETKCLFLICFSSYHLA